MSERFDILDHVGVQDSFHDALKNYQEMRPKPGMAVAAMAEIGKQLHKQLIKEGYGNEEGVMVASIIGTFDNLMLPNFAPGNIKHNLEERGVGLAIVSGLAEAHVESIDQKKS
jgi:hypothetical protein